MTDSQNEALAFTAVFLGLVALFGTLGLLFTWIGYMRDRRNDHKNHTGSQRFDGCRWCREHDWDAWLKDACKCPRCRRIRDLEDDTRSQL